MSPAKTLLLSLAINLTFSGILCASFPEDDKGSRKITKGLKEQQKNASALIQKRQNSPKPPRETCGAQFNEMQYKDSKAPKSYIVYTE